jgi:hypothetical protein
VKDKDFDIGGALLFVFLLACVLLAPFVLAWRAVVWLWRKGAELVMYLWNPPWDPPVVDD